MSLIDPTPPPYDALAWERTALPERLRLACRGWALQGYGSPPAIYLFYLAKLALFVWAWFWFCGWSVHLGSMADVATWWHHPDALRRAVVWAMLYEVMGLGCGSGPLTGHYLPPIGGALYFLRPGTIKLPFAEWRVLGGDRRSLLDVMLYAALLAALGRALVMPTLTPSALIPIVVLVPLLGLRDKTLFLAARSEHYLSLIVVFCFPADTVAGAKVVQLAIWWWAAFSKLNHHFPSVIGVMTSNSPVLRFPWLRKLMYRQFPDDLRPSGLATWMAHGGTVVEFAFPLALVLGRGGPITTYALVIMVGFHFYITSNVPMAVPIEWNVVMVYAGLVLFGAHGGSAPPWMIASPIVVVFLAAAVFLVPLSGNLWPRHFSFLMAMRYYAGNWAFSVWLFRGELTSRLDDSITKPAPWVRKQLARFYDPQTIAGLLSRVMAFRAMHLHGRTLIDLLPRAVDSLGDYEYTDGEIVAGVVLGYNFGCGHLHQEQLLAAVQNRCNFEPGDLRCVFVESQPLGNPNLRWRICDASTGQLDSGEIAVTSLLARQPWEPCDSHLPS